MFDEYHIFEDVGLYIHGSGVVLVDFRDTPMHHGRVGVLLAKISPFPTH